MFYRFRKELVEALMQEHEVILSTPFVGHEDDLQAMGLRCINTEIDRRSINPFKDMKLLKTYRKMLDEIRPDMVITYSIKPNIYMGSACKAKDIPYVTNVQGLGTAYEKTVYLPFEHIRLPAPCGYDEVLTAEYGDYMVPVKGTADHDYPFYRHMEEDLKREIQRAGFKGTVEEFCEKVSAGELYV